MATNRTSGIPITLQLDPATYRALDIIASRKGTTMRALIATYLARSVERSIATPKRSKYANRLTPEQVAKIEPMTRAGMSASAIARELGVTESAIEQRRHRMGLTGLSRAGRARNA